MRAVDRLLQRWRAAVAGPWIPRGARVLDVGCHQGEFLDRLRGRIGPSVGLDPLVRASSSEQVRLVADVFPPTEPFPTGSFDVVVMLATLEHIRDKDRVAAECGRVLAAGGRVVVTVPARAVDRVVDALRWLRLADGMSLDEHHGYDPRETPIVFARHGFQLERWRRFQLGLNHLFVFRKASGADHEHGARPTVLSHRDAGKSNTPAGVRTARSAVLGIIVTLGLLVPTGGCGGKTGPPPDAEALKELDAFHATVETDENGRVTALKLEGADVTDAALDPVARLPELKSLSLYGSAVTDSGLAKLSGAKKLESLGLGRTSVTRRGMVHLERLPALRWVWLTENAKVSPTEVEDFKRKAVPGIIVYR